MISVNVIVNTDQLLKVILYSINPIMQHDTWVFR